MEILVSAGMIIFAIAFFMYIFLASAILFCDAPVSLIGALFSFFCLCPIGRHKIHIGREMKYRWADCISEVNPLYVSGFFRKSASDKNILSNLKGKFYCETALCGIWAIAFICKICTIYMNANIGKYVTMYLEAVLQLQKWSGVIMLCIINGITMRLFVTQRDRIIYGNLSAI